MSTFDSDPGMGIDLFDRDKVFQCHLDPSIHSAGPNILSDGRPPRAVAGPDGRVSWSSADHGAIDHDFRARDVAGIVRRNEHVTPAQVAVAA